MNRDEILHKVKELNLPSGSFVVFGSCPLAVAGIRQSQDIDMLVSEQLFMELRNRGWQEVDKGKNDNPLTYNVFEAHCNWDFSSYSPTLRQLLATALVIDGIPFAAIEEVRKWKEASGRPKDLQDIKLIDNYLQKINT